MTFKDLRLYFQQSLGEYYPAAEIQSFYFILLNHYGSYRTADILAQPDTILSETQLSQLREAVTALQTFKPLQYILGETSFFSHRFLVNENVLIPRPETEELVDWVLQECRTSFGKEGKSVRILDIGTGSGCIAISIAKALPQAEVSAIDFSVDALRVAQYNAQLNGVKLHFWQQDILQVEVLPEYYHIIISNPPYVRELEKEDMQPNVLDYEPHSALFVPNATPLLFYDKIADLAKAYLHPKGKLFFEINQYFGQEMKELLLRKGFQSVVLRKDLLGNDRMLKGEQEK
ncbi:MAG: peptide chain release factor N(5)-glutamine methyltransferase [Capnocytophaga sp.]|uniref:peptide chain release factor N(5)-glutamine methyltransferase n=1 Tax=Capnocytophaga sp. TaxID=44737 RepID=UPI003FA00829